MNFFTREFFEQISIDFQNSFRSGSVYDLYALKANQELFSKSIRVFGTTDTDGKKMYYANYKASLDTHRALVICQESIEVCKHPKDKVETVFSRSVVDEIECFVCQCGAEVKIAGFEEV